MIDVARHDPTALADLFKPFIDPQPAKTAGSRMRVFTPVATFWLFLQQCLTIAQSCREAVVRLRAAREGDKLKGCSVNTGCFCRARRRLSLQWLLGLIRSVADRVEATAPKKWLWCGLRVLVVDGTTMTCADTPANQAEWAQPKSQEPGCGFPALRMVAVFSLMTGVLMAQSLGAMTIGEVTLFMQLLQQFSPGDVVLRDRGFASYALAAVLLQQQVHSVTRIHQRLSASIQEVRRIAKGDRIMRWTRPKNPTAGFTDLQWRELPDSIEVRVIDVVVDIPGLRTRSLTLITTLLDPKCYPAEALADLYRRRWYVELYFGMLKTDMGIDYLATKSPEMVRRDLAMHLIAYNLLRGLVVKAALTADTTPSSLCFTAAMQIVRQYTPELHAHRRRPATMIKALIAALGTCTDHHRADRTSPRARKRRPSQYPLLTRHRKDYKEIQHRKKYTAPADQKCAVSAV